MVPKVDSNDMRREKYIADLLAADTPLKCKQIGNAVTNEFRANYDKFMTIAKHIMRSVIWAKNLTA